MRTYVNGTCKTTADKAYDLYFHGEVDEAERVCFSLLASDPSNVEALLLLGDINHGKGALEAALYYLDLATRFQPGLAVIHNNRGTILKTMGQKDGARRAFEKAASLTADYHLPWYNLGLLQQEDGQDDEALSFYRRALQLKPDHIPSYLNIGTIYTRLKQHDLAREWYFKGLEHAPDDISLLNSLCQSWSQSGRFAEALALAERSLMLKPGQPEAHSNLGSIYGWGGLAAEGVAHLRQAIADIEDLTSRRRTHDNILMIMHYSPHFSPEETAEEHFRWGRLYGGSHQQRPFIREPDDMPIRIGYVSPDLRMHPVAFFIAPILLFHDRSRFDVFCYADVPKPDHVTDQLKERGVTWRDISGLSDEQVMETIVGDKIDILVDLAGHTAGNRLMVFAAKPAPIQVTWLGYPDTTGLGTVDYRITDAVADPPGMTEHLHTESLVRLPGTFLCYPPPNDAPSVAPASHRENVRITFGSFNNFAKISPEMLNCWATILKEVPESRLLIKALGMEDSWIRQRLETIFSSNSVEPDRLLLVNKTIDIKEHLSLLSEMDILFDTYPYNGTTTTCESLWMGVPVVTLAGESHVSRVGASLLTSVGLPELIANSEEEYREIAIRLASDKERLAAYRNSLREIMLHSSLTDAAGFTRNLEHAFQSMWQKLNKRPLP